MDNPSEQEISEQEERLLRQHGSTLSDGSFGSSSTVIATPTTPKSPTHRPGYRRIASVAEEITSYHESPSHQDTLGGGHGLGIKDLKIPNRESISRVPVGRTRSPSTPGTTDALLSPALAKLNGKNHLPTEARYEAIEEDGAYTPPHPPYQPYSSDNDRERLHTRTASGNTMGYEKDFKCKTRPFKIGRGSWLAISMMILSIYSTVFSGIWLMIAIRRPRYGHTITTAGRLSPNTASLLCAAFAKSIELSFVTVFVAFLGQLLSTRALVKKKGVTIAEMSMRSWVMQPGTMLAHWESVRYAGFTFLGIFALVAALMAMIYTTASDALVAPKLKLGKIESRLMYGSVATQFANPQWIEDQCTTPIPITEDVDYGTTCIAIQHSGEAYHNYMQYLATWVDNIDTGNGSSNQGQRPDPVGMLYDNTTVKGSWMQVSENNMTTLSANFKRTVNNVTMAMPHAGVFAAAKDPINGIIQPRELNGLGEYNIQASVPSPALNVLCANMSSEEMVPMVYTLWPKEFNNGTLPNATNWPDQFNLTQPSSLTKTVVDDLFNFDDINKHPIFPKLPLAWNTVMNYSINYGPQAMYILTTSPTSTYTMCSLRVAQTPNCSTEYHSGMSGGSLNSHCEDPTDSLAYAKSEPKAPNGMWISDWRTVASQWALAISLNAGIFDGDASNARLLAQLIPTTPSLNPSLPSISEALAVLAGNTLLLSSLQSPFIHYWNYSTTVPTLTDPQYQAFNATIQAQDYASGGTQSWQNMFYIVLLLVFIANVCCLLYFILHGSLVTDFIEPQNLFSLSINSPPSAVLEGSCGAGPERGQFRTKWHIELDREHDHFYIESRDAPRSGAGNKSWQSRVNADEHPELGVGYEMKSPVARMYSQLSRKRTSLL